MRNAEEHFFTTHDGVELFYRRWPALRAPARGAIALFHRGHEHSLNQRGAYLHVLGDLLGSIGVLTAGAIVLATCAVSRCPR